MARKRKPLIRRLRRKFRLSLLHEASYEELFSVLLTPLNVILMIIGLVAVVGLLSYAITALTPLREYIVPGYVDEQHRKDARYARFQVDSLQAIVDVQNQYYANLRSVLLGEIPSDSVAQRPAAGVNDDDLGFQLSREDSLLRVQVEEEDRFILRVGSSGTVETRSNRGILFKPVEGSVSSLFDPDHGHFGIDLVAPRDAMIRAVAPGTVILSSFTVNGGHVIGIQHDNNLVSMYKHNSALLKSVGDPVKVGESIAIIGNTGDHSDGPHLHFELWKRGVPVDPMEYLIFDE